MAAAKAARAQKRLEAVREQQRIDQVQDRVAERYIASVDGLKLPLVMATPLGDTILFYTIGMPELAKQPEFAMAIPMKMQDGTKIMNNLARAMIKGDVKLAELEGKMLDKKVLDTLCDFRVDKIAKPEKHCVQAIKSRAAIARCANEPGFGVMYQLVWPAKNGAFEFNEAQPRL
jgi:hypothetical protein